MPNEPEPFSAIVNFIIPKLSYGQLGWPLLDNPWIAPGRKEPADAK